MIENQSIKLVRLKGTYLFNQDSKILLANGYIDLAEERFIAVGLEKSKAAKDWEDYDYFNLIVLTKGIDDKYYLSKIEYITDILAPKYVESDRTIQWVSENTKSKDKILIDNLYCLNDCRDEYTLTINDKPYSFYEKYIVYLISVSYEIGEYNLIVTLKS